MDWKQIVEVIETVSKLNFGQVMEFFQEKLDVREIDIFNAQYASGNDAVMIEIYGDMFNIWKKKSEPLYMQGEDIVKKFLELFQKHESSFN